MSAPDRQRAAALEAALNRYHREHRPLPGIESSVRKESLVRQLVDSTRRTDYVRVMRQRPLTLNRTDPNNALFDPVLGAIVYAQAGDVEEAFWLTFLGTHCGKALSSGWELCRALYGRLGGGPTSTWNRTQADVGELCAWIDAHADQIKSGPPPRRFGNHRKYEPIRNKGQRGTPLAIRTYVDWIAAAGSHVALIDGAISAADGDRYAAFDHLYRSMSTVASFGRLAKFDYLSMLGKLGLAPIAAGSTYLGTSTGPLAGAALLFSGNPEGSHSPSVMDAWLRDLGEALGVTMQDLEDALCNWQKSPDTYRQFRG